MKRLPQILLLGCLLLGTWMITGCQTPESADNESSRPWNAPRQWETGLPGFTPDRR